MPQKGQPLATGIIVRVLNVRQFLRQPIAYPERPIVRYGALVEGRVGEETPGEAAPIDPAFVVVVVGGSLFHENAAAVAVGFNVVAAVVAEQGGCAALVAGATFAEEDGVGGVFDFVAIEALGLNVVSEKVGEG